MQIKKNEYIRNFHYLWNLSETKINYFVYNKYIFVCMWWHFGYIYICTNSMPRKRYFVFFSIFFVRLFRLIISNDFFLLSKTNRELHFFRFIFSPVKYALLKDGHCSLAADLREQYRVASVWIRFCSCCCCFCCKWVTWLCAGLLLHLAH